MPDTLTHIKIGVMQRRRKLRDLADGIGEDYTRLSKIINGYMYPPMDFEKRVRETFARWDAADGRTPDGGRTDGRP